MNVTQHVAALLFTRFALEVGNINLLEKTWLLILVSKTMDEV